MEKHCYGGHEVEYGHDWSDFDPGHEYIACPLFQDEGLGCTYFRWVDLEAPNGKKTSLLGSIRE